MTDINLIEHLSDFHDAQSRMAHWMHGAMQLHAEVDDVRCWLYLFEWAEARVERDQVFKRLKDRYSDAIMLREGGQ